MNKLAVKNLLHSPIGSIIATAFIGVRVFAIAIVVWSCTSFDIGRLQTRIVIAQLFAVTVFFTVLLTNYSLVSSRARQIALLRALGASRGFIARAVIGESAVPLLAGLGLGFALTAVAKRLMQRRVNVEIPYSLDLYLVAAVAGLGGSLYRALQIVRKFLFYFRTGPR